MELVDDIDRLVEFVEGLTHSLAGADEMAPLWELDAAISAKCHLLEVQMPAFEVEKYQRFGFAQVPYLQRWDGMRFLCTSNWQQAMRNLRAIVVAKSESIIAPDDCVTARSQQQIVAYAKEHFGESPDERSLRNWIANGSLRARQRGLIWEFSNSDLRTLVLGRSK